MIVSNGPLAGYRIEGTLTPGNTLSVVKQDGTTYKARIKVDGSVLCNCMHHRFKGQCKHSDYISTLVEKPERYARARVEPYIKDVLEKLRPAYEQAEVAGSYRRQKSTLKDADILLVGDPIHALEIVEKIAIDVVMSGEYIIRFHYGLPKFLIDLTFTSKETWGAALLYRTGSLEFNIRCRGEAKRRGWKLNEYGLWDANNNLIEAASEEKILSWLDIEWISPEKR